MGETPFPLPALVHGSTWTRSPPNPRPRHRLIADDSSLPRSVIRFKTLHARRAPRASDRLDCAREGHPRGWTVGGTTTRASRALVGIGEGDRVVGRVPRDPGDATGRRPDEINAHGRVIGRRLGQRVRDDHAGAVDAQMARLPASRAASAVFRNCPFALTHDGQLHAVDDEEMHRYRCRDEHADMQPLTPSRERRVVRGVETGAHHGHDRTDEPLRLAQGQAEDEPERERRLDRQIGEPRLPTWSAGRRRAPRSPGVWGEPQRHVAPPDECALVRPPTPHLIPRLVGRMDSRLDPRSCRGHGQRANGHTPISRAKGPGAVHQRLRDVGPVENEVSPVAGTAASEFAGRLHPGRDIAFAVEDTPHVDVIVALDVEDQVGMAPHRHASQAGQVQFERVAWRPAGGMAADARERLLERINERERDTLPAFFEVVRHRFIDVAKCEDARDDALRGHRGEPASVRTLARRPSK